MKLYDFCSKDLKKAVKMCGFSSFVVAYFIFAGITHLYDIIFMVSFVVLIIRYFSVED